MCGVTQSGHFFYFLHPFDTDNCVLRVFLRFCSCLLLTCHLSRYGGEPARKKDKRKNGAWTRTKKEKADRFMLFVAELQLLDNRVNKIRIPFLQ